MIEKSKKCRCFLHVVVFLTTLEPWFESGVSVLVLDRLSQKKPKYFTILDLTASEGRVMLHEIAFLISMNFSTSYDFAIDCHLGGRMNFSIVLLGVLTSADDRYHFHHYHP